MEAQIFTSFPASKRRKCFGPVVAETNVGSSVAIYWVSSTKQPFLAPTSSRLDVQLHLELILKKCLLQFPLQGSPEVHVLHLPTTRAHHRAAALDKPSLVLVLLYLIQSTEVYTSHLHLLRSSHHFPTRFTISKSRIQLLSMLQTHR